MKYTNMLTKYSQSKKLNFIKVIPSTSIALTKTLIIKLFMFWTLTLKKVCRAFQIVASVLFCSSWFNFLGEDVNEDIA